MNRRSVSPCPHRRLFHGRRPHPHRGGGRDGNVNPNASQKFRRWTRIIACFIVLDIGFLFYLNGHRGDGNMHEIHGQLLRQRQQQQRQQPQPPPPPSSQTVRAKVKMSPTIDQVLLQDPSRRNLSEEREEEEEEGMVMRGIDDASYQREPHETYTTNETFLLQQKNDVERVDGDNHDDADGEDDEDDKDDQRMGNSASTNTTTTTTMTMTTTISLLANMTPRVVRHRGLPTFNMNHEIDRYLAPYIPQGRRVSDLRSAHANAHENNDSITDDPLRNPSWNFTRRAVTYDIKLPYLGVLIDGGRHYFPIRWLERVVDYISAMKYNLIQLRLTDDQAFNVLFESRPELAQPAPVNNPHRRVWTVPELRHLVQYARRRNVSIMPEINVPGHGGAWAGIPGLISHCPKYLCRKGYSVPLNVSHPNFLPVLQDVINETLRIFDPPFLHLGGDEVDMARPCFQELGVDMYDYPAFEVELQGILDRLGYPADQVVRWEMTNSWAQISPNYCGARHRKCDKTDKLVRAGGIEHFWESYPYERHNPTPRIFLSNRLYQDTNGEQDALDVFDHAQASFNLRGNIKPTALIVGGFELSTQFWYDRNVLGRLLGVSMGVSRPDFPAKWSKSRIHEYLYDEFKRNCERLGMGHTICESNGIPLISTRSYRSVWEKGWDVWKAEICERATHGKKMTEFKPFGVLSSSVTRRATDPNTFWENFGQLQPEFIPIEDNSTSKNQTRTTNIGVIVDTTSSLASEDRLKHLVHIFHELKFDTIQLTLAGDRGFTFRSNVLNTVPFSMLNSDKRHSLYSSDFLTFLGRLARRKGIEIFPEISFKTNAGGWFGTGMLAECPRVFCAGGSVAVDITIPTVLPVLLIVIGELLSIFPGSYIHLGHDEREASQACYDEAGIVNVSHDRFEAKLRKLLDFADISDDNILRYQNQENKEYGERAGKITHYQAGFDPESMETDHPFFVTVDVLDDSAFQVYERTKELMKLDPRGVLAELRHLERYQWVDYQIADRLLAFAMGSGAYPDEDYTEQSFGAAFLRLCKEIDYPDFKCTEIPGPIASVQHVTDTEDWRDAQCKIRTYENEIRTIKDYIPPIYDETTRAILFNESELLEDHETLPPLSSQDMKEDEKPVEHEYNTTKLDSNKTLFHNSIKLDGNTTTVAGNTTIGLGEQTRKEIHFPNPKIKMIAQRNENAAFLNQQHQQQRRQQHPGNASITESFPEVHWPNSQEREHDHQGRDGKKKNIKMKKRVANVIRYQKPLHSASAGALREDANRADRGYKYQHD